MLFAFSTTHFKLTSIYFYLFQSTTISIGFFKLRFKVKVEGVEYSFTMVFDWYYIFFTYNGGPILLMYKTAAKLPQGSTLFHWKDRGLIVKEDDDSWSVRRVSNTKEITLLLDPVFLILKAEDLSYWLSRKKYVYVSEWVCVCATLENNKNIMMLH